MSLSYREFQEEWYGSSTTCRDCGYQLVDQEYVYCELCEWEDEYERN